MKINKGSWEYKMKINKGSWHYKLWAWTWDKLNDSNAPSHTNLCSYFWRLILAPIALLLKWVLLPTVLVGGVAFSLFVICRGTIHLLGWYSLLIFPLVAFIVSLFKVGKTDTAQLVGAYVAAKKQGVCPLIEFEDIDGNKEDSNGDK